MAVRKRGAGYQTDFLLKGWERVRCQFETEAEAKAYELECRAAHALGKPRPEPQGEAGRAGRVYTIEELVRHCSQTRWRSQKSGQHTAQRAMCFAEWTGPKLPIAQALTPMMVDRYVLERQTNKGVGGSTINRHLSAISVLLDQAVRLGLIPTKFDLPWQKEASHRVRFYSPEEERQILQAVTQWGYPEWADFFIFLTDTGGRVGETLKLRWEDIRKQAITFSAENTKNGESRTVWATPRVVEALERCRARNPHSRGPFEWVKPQALRTIWYRLRANLPWMGEDTVVHTFRHTCASRFAQRGIDLYRVKTWMGHKTIQTTQRYAHLMDQQMEDMAKVLAA